MQPEDDPELDTEQLLEQGDELLRASRRLLADLDDVIDPSDDADRDQTDEADQTGESSDSR